MGSGTVVTNTLYASSSDLQGNGTITVSAGAVLDANMVFDTSRTATMAFGSSGMLNLTVSGGILGAGYKQDGSLRIANGVSLTSASGLLGHHIGSSGTATVSGIGSRWTNSNELRIGSSGSGSLMIEAGGQVSNTIGYLGNGVGAAGTASVSGVGSKWTNSGDLYVGNAGDGTLGIEAGGQASSSSGYLGYSSDSTGAIVISGAGSTWTCSNLYIGHSGSGTLSVETGGQASSPTSYVGYNSGSVGAVTVNGVGASWGSVRDLYVGYSGNGTLNVENGGQAVSGEFSGNYNTYIGYESGSSGAATVSGEGSRWTNRSSLYVGFSGSGSLTVNDGGLVTAKTLYASPSDLVGNGTISANGAVLDTDIVFDSTHGIAQTLNFGTGGALNLTISATSVLGAGYKNSGSLRIADGVAVASTSGLLGDKAGSSGTATVSGAGSRWTMSGDLHVGNAGSGTLSIEKGAQVVSGGNTSNYRSYIGNTTGSSGVATVSGAGSRWTVTSPFYIGNSGIGVLRIEDGGQVNNNNNSPVYVGGNAGSSGTVIVSGTGSKWTNIALYVGYSGDGTLIVEAGGQVSGGGFIGYNGSSTGTATVTGAGSTWTTNGILYVGNAGNGRLTVSDGGLVSAKTLFASPSDLFGDGTITVNGVVLDTDLVFDSTHGTSQTLAFGSGGTLNVIVNGTSAFGVGHKGSGSLRIADGKVLASTTGFLGNTAGATGAATVSGAGSKWTNSSILFVGFGGSGTLTIEGGGQVSNSFRGYVGAESGSTGVATVSGAGSMWTNSNDLYIGDQGSGMLSIENGGQVSNSNGYLGNSKGSLGVAKVSGTGSTWTSNKLDVGTSGNGTLTIENGGQVSSLVGVLGRNAGASGTAKVSGAGSEWTNSGDLSVGSSGSGSLTIEAGGQVSNRDGLLGDSGTATVSGTGSMWINASALRVGNGKLTVLDGGLVSAKTLFASLRDLHGNGTITASGGAVLDADLVFNSSNSATLTFGSGGTLNLTVDRGDLGVGYKGAGSLRVVDGVTVTSTGGYLGCFTGATGTATVSGAGSKWTNSTLSVGSSGGTGILTIESGGQVSSGSGGLTGTVTVTGPGSKWVISNTLSITGDLSINAGGQVSSNAHATIGYGYRSSGSATVSGIGSTWTNSVLYVGSSSNGILTIEAGGQVSSSDGYIGYSTEAIGRVTVTGAGSTWTNNRLYVGSSGSSGTLTVADGAQVTAKALYASLGDLYGNGTIAANGAVLDANLTFDGTHGTTQTLAFGSGGRLNLTLDGTNPLGVGYKGGGSLRIADGLMVASAGGYVGHNTGSTGIAAVSGTGSAWSSTGILHVGYRGSGTLFIEGGGHVNSTEGYLGANASSTGTATVSGTDSKWTNSGRLYVGDLGRGTLTVADGGLVTAKSMGIGSACAVRLHVSGDAMLVLGDAVTNGGLSNNGTVSFIADASLPAGTYRPISEYAGRTMTWSGSGSYKGFGGIWNTTAKTFTVTEPTALSSGASDTLTTGERLLFTDPSTGQRVGVSFGTITGSLNFSAAPMTPANLASLASLLGDNDAVLSAWTFTTNLTGGEAMLSFDIGPDAQDLSIWRFSNNVWSAYTPSLFTYDSHGLASFTVNSFSGYAISAVVPEPASATLLALATTLLLTRRQRKSASA